MYSVISSLMGCALLFSSLQPAAFAAGKGKPKDPNAMKFQAYDFAPWDSLSVEVQSLLERYFASGDAQIELPGDISLPSAERYLLWTELRDAQAASFFAIHNALSHLHASMGDGSKVTVSEMVLQIRSMGGDRTFFTLDDALFQKWRTAGNGNFEMSLANDQIETGRFQFTAGNGQGGSLHKGYDIQGSSSMAKTPRIQINYRFADFDADIDIDGYYALNPKHLTWENSDVRFWYDSYLRKYGYPGFRVKLR